MNEQKEQLRIERVERAVVRRATGYQVPLKKTFKVKRVTYDPTTGKKIAEEEVLELGMEEVHVPGDLRAAAYYLNNRAPERWREHPSESEATTSMGGIVLLPDIITMNHQESDDEEEGGDAM